VPTVRKALARVWCQLRYGYAAERRVRSDGGAPARCLGRRLGRGAPTGWGTVSGAGCGVQELAGAGWAAGWAECPGRGPGVLAGARRGGRAERWRCGGAALAGGVLTGDAGAGAVPGSPDHPCGGRVGTDAVSPDHGPRSPFRLAGPSVRRPRRGGHRTARPRPLSGFRHGGPSAWRPRRGGTPYRPTTARARRGVAPTGQAMPCRPGRTFLQVPTSRPDVARSCPVRPASISTNSGARTHSLTVWTGASSGWKTSTA
jgi:hypothetical protein